MMKNDKTCGTQTFETETVRTIVKACEIAFKNTLGHFKMIICEEMASIYIKIYDFDDISNVYDELEKNFEIMYPWDEDKSYIEIFVKGGYETVNDESYEKIYDSKYANVHFYSFDELVEIL